MFGIRLEGAAMGIRGRVLLFVFLAAILAASLSSGVLAASETFVITQLTDNAEHDTRVAISGDRVVWWRGSGICSWTPSEGIVQIGSSLSSYTPLPRISGDRMVWYEVGCSGNVWFRAITTWTPASGVRRLAFGSVAPLEFDVSGDRVVWLKFDGTNNEIFTWTPSEGTRQITYTNWWHSAPRVSGDRIVWTQGSSETWDLFTWTPEARGELITLSRYGRPDAKVSGDRVVWTVSDGTDQEVFTWTPAAGMIKITSNSHDDLDPQISGDRIVWCGHDGSDREIFTWTPAGGTTRVTSNGDADVYPQVSGDRIVWAGYRDNRWELLTWTPAAGTTRVTSDVGYDAAPQVSGDRIVWRKYDGSDYEVFTAVPGSSSTATRYEQTYPYIVKTGTWSEFTSAPSSGGSYGRSSTAGATATIRFTGTKIAWIGMKGSTPGIVDVYLDNVKKATLDLYASPAQHQVTLWTSETLANTSHTLRLVRNSASLSGEFLVLDAVDIWGMIKAPGASLIPAPWFRTWR